MSALSVTFDVGIVFFLYSRQSKIFVKGIEIVCQSNSIKSVFFNLCTLGAKDTVVETRLRFFLLKHEQRLKQMF